ncbi:MAG: arginine--tRNA ligase [Candidatus Woesearchaeota archaeon]
MDFKESLSKELATIIGKEISTIKDLLEKPKHEQFGDYAFPCFSLAKEFRKSPVQIAQELENTWKQEEDLAKRFSAKAQGPYLNFTIPTESLVKELLPPFLDSEGLVAEDSDKETILVESPGPNTNKPLHLGHLRNMLLGSTLKNVLQAKGHDAKIVNVVNDRGIHISKSMLAYQKWGQGKTPESEGVKPDHFVGQFYVKFAQEAAKSDDAKEQLETEAQEMLRKWEQGDEDVMKLWKLMNSWVYAGFKKTYDKLDFRIVKDYFESDTYKGGRDLILQGLEKGVFEQDESGAVLFDPEDEKLGKKVMLRSDGTTVYITQDVDMARLRYDDFSFDRMIYVVANEQEHHFKVLFEAFKALEFPFADKCHHFAYGMVELPSGKMKSREGTVIDTDDLIEEMESLARREVEKRYDDLDEKEIAWRSEAIALSAIRFFFLKHDPLKNFVFDKEESLSFEGETGPYVQYTHARICSITRKSGQTAQGADLNLLNTFEDKKLVKLISEFDNVLFDVSKQLKPSSLCHYLIRLCQEFNTYYSQHKIIQDDKSLEKSRLALITALKNVLATGLELLDITALEKM